MKHTRRNAAVALVLLLAIVFGCMFAADRIQRGNGTIAVTEGWIETDVGNLMYKLYTPKTATAENPVSGVLLLHGYQNDHETCAAYAIELARRGAVVLCLDEYGHGSTTAGLINRGYVNHKVTVNYGEDSIEDGTFKTIGGQTRYKVMMNFSNLSFFDKHYTTDADGNSMTDSSAGGSYAYALLAAMDNVDPARLALSGHSMGTWSSWSVAANFCGTDVEPKAVVLQCGELFRDSAYDAENIHFNNVLLLQAKYDEFSYFRDYKNIVDDELLKSDLRTEFLGCTTDEAAGNTTYGTFEDGTARRMELLNTNHRLTTHNAHGLATALTWFSDTIGLDLTLAPIDQVAMTKETLVLIAMLAAVASLMAVMELLLTTPFFSGAVQPLPDKASVKPNGAWWRGAIITMLLAAATYPFMTQARPRSPAAAGKHLPHDSRQRLFQLVFSSDPYHAGHVHHRLSEKQKARRAGRLAEHGARYGCRAGAHGLGSARPLRAAGPVHAGVSVRAAVSLREGIFCWTSGSSGRSSRPLTQPGSDSSASTFRSLRCSLS